MRIASNFVCKSFEMRNTKLTMNKTVSDFCYHFTGWTENNHAASFEKMKLILNGKAFMMNRNQRAWNISQGYRKKTSLALSHFYIKMICFTETPILFLKDIVSKKGGFCIGMKKEWLIRSGGQNVIYVDNNNPNDYGRALTELKCRYRAPQVEDMDTQESAKIHSSLTEALIAATEDIAFRDEREWRIIRNDLNEFMTNDDISFEIADVESIWCLDEYFDKLLLSLKSHDEYNLLLPLIKPLSKL